MPPLAAALHVQTSSQADSRRPGTAAHGAHRLDLVALATLFALIAFHLALSRGALRLAADSADEQVLLVYPVRLLNGSVLYRDIFSAYGPSVYWLLAVLYHLFGPTVIAERLVGLTFHSSLIAAMFLLGRPQGLALAVVAGVVPCILLVSLGAVAYAWVAAFSLLLLSVALAFRGSSAGVIWAGVLAGVAVSFRPDLLLAALAVPVTVVGLQRRQLMRLGTGLVIGLLPLAAQLVATPSDLVDDVIGGRVLRGAAASRLPLPTSGEDGLLLLVVVLSVTVSCAVSVADRFKNRLANAGALLSMFALPQAVQRADWTHLVMAASVTVALTVVLVTSRLRAHFRQPSVIVSTAGALTLTSLFVAMPHRVTRPLVESALGHYGEVVELHHDGRSLPVSSHRARYLRPTVDRIAGLAGPNTRLFIGPLDLQRPAATDLSAYFLLPHVAQSARQMEITPGVTNVPRYGVMKDLEAAGILLLIDNGTQWQRLFPYAGPGSPIADRYVRQHFCVVSSLGYYRILVRRAVRETVASELASCGEESMTVTPAG